MTALPVIDLSPLRETGDGGQVPAAIRAAMEAHGFFYVTGHGLSGDLIARTRAAALDFFRRPVEEKRKVAVTKHHRGWNALGDARMYGAEKPDYKEFFQVGLDLPLDDPDVAAGQPLRGPNVFPDEPTAFRPAFEAWFRAIAEAGDLLLQGVALSLETDRHFFRPHYGKPLQRTQAVWYPRQPMELGEDQFGVAPHTDFGLITLLWQDGSGGLEVLHPNDGWIAAPPAEGTLVVNAGDLMQRWTGGRYRSTPHRARNRHVDDRLSIATFYDPAFTAPVDPADFGAEGEATTAGEHILGRINESFGYRKKAS
ncbi:MAG: isopenicillin N synthase family dioxygenase [Minwuia sp.]|uniref:isopenicillin N synthase family dioxygenase n=1 Tax=Minwuia sp. TaxID=2493630 RepID=UPI003A8C7C0C